MAEKYYITNGNKVLGSVVVNGKKSYVKVPIKPGVAARFKYSDALRLISSRLNGDIRWSAQKIYSTKSGKNYIVTNASNFVANNGCLTNVFKNAKAFKSIADADAYIRSHKELIKDFSEPFIINDNFEPVEKTDRKQFTEEQLKTIGVKPKNTGRVIASKAAKIEIYDKSQHKCAICGKPLEYIGMTIDHIVPISRGGANTANNLRCVCEDCNKIKGNRLDDEMYRGLINICSIKAYDEPDDDLWNMFIRAKVRGEIKKYLTRGDDGLSVNMVGK